ncbi:PP2C family protein-serine/threonine phosphatase [Candidatus Omnitrophota bacterium]
MKILKAYDKIPKHYLEEFTQRQAALIKGRIQLFALLFMMVFVTGGVVNLIITNQEFTTPHLVNWAFLVFTSISAILYSIRIKGLKQAKQTAFILLAILLAIITHRYMMISIDMPQAIIIYLFMIFGTALTIPWISAEVFLVCLMVFLFYTVLFVSTPTYIYKNVSMCRDLPSYLQGLLLISLAYFITFVTRKHESRREIENFVLLKEVEANSAKMQRELDLATKVHKTLIPKSISTDLADIAVMYLPMAYIGGDYAKFHFIDKDKLLFIICDVTGHGVSAALLVNRLHTEFERLAREKMEPGMLLKELDRFITRDFEGMNMYLSAFCGLLDFKRKRLIYSNYGHPDQYIYRVSESSIRQLSSQGSLLGIPLYEEKIYQQDIEFGAGDKILLFTDGVIEAKNKEGRQFGKEKLEDFLRLNHDDHVDIINQKLVNELNLFKSKAFDDDIIILSIQIHKPSGKWF